jgi:P4 family phage/plasmid primase-like protien
VTDPSDSAVLAAALAPLLERVRTDVTAVKAASGAQAWTREPLTPERVARHLNGGPARGVSQIKAGESVTLVAVLDFDSHRGDVAWPTMVDVAVRVAGVLELAHGLAPILWRSSGGSGLHLYLLWDEPQDAYSVRTLLGDALITCGLRSGVGGVARGQVETFPKQNEVPLDGFGNQVVLPLAGASVPLVWEPLVDGWMAGSRADASAAAWPVSEPVPVRQRPVRPPREAGTIVGLEELQAVLETITNAGSDELTYDEWLRVVFAVHHETGGSVDGLSLVHEISARCSRYNEGETDKQWTHAHSDRGAVVGIGTLRHLAFVHGWRPPLDVGVFDDVSEGDDDPPLPPGSPPSGPQASGSSGAARPPALPPAAPRPARRGIPEAQHLTTDQANANRLVEAFGRRVLVAAGRWHAWDGKRWAADEADVYRYGCRLSAIIHDEATAVVARAADGDQAARDKAAAIAKALKAWALKSEMKGSIEAAIGLARKMLTVDEKLLDADPWALNVANGIVDLRTGDLRPHDPDELITKLVPVAYRPEARCDVWLRVLGQVTLGNAGLEAYLQRWAGYCLTGAVTEQVFTVLWGGGSNGKSTFVAALSETEGDYATTAAPGLLMATKGAGERHPTEIASLMGRRMVTAHESGEGVVLREDFIKQATGDDVLTARFMRGDFFEFSPTHKLQLLTNHKPSIKGQDHGIWRRIHLVPFLASFGTEDQVRAGTHTHLRDLETVAAVRAELEGVLAWRVRGAVAWAEGGLQPPGLVLEASDSYKSEQDRVGQFIRECCERGAELSEPLTDGMGGLYPAYQSWCRDGGIHPLAKGRFVDDVLRVTGERGLVEFQSSVENGKRRKLRLVRGLRLLPD